MQLERMILEGLQRHVRQHFRLAADPILISTNDRWKLADRFNRQKPNAEPLKLPAVFMRLTSLRINGDSYNAGALYRQGQYAPAKEGDDVMTKYHMLPTVYGFELIHLSENFFDMLSFSRDYILATRDRPKLNYNLNFDGINIDIKVLVDDEVTVPEKDTQLDIPNGYELTANLLVHGYCMRPLEEAKSIEVITQVASSLTVMT